MTIQELQAGDLLFVKDASDLLLDKFTVRHLKQIDVNAALQWLDAATGA